MLQSSLRQAHKTHSLLGTTAQFGFRKNYQAGFYNMRFKPSQGLDNNYIYTAAPFHGPDGSESVSLYPSQLHFAAPFFANTSN